MVSKSTPPVQSVARAIAILKSFSHEHPEMGVGQISRQLGLPKSTVFRLLSTLEAGGLISQDPATSSYRLGVELISLASYVLEYGNLRSSAQPKLRELGEIIRETVNLTILDQCDAVNIEQYVPPGRLVMRVGWVGRRMPANTVSSGKAILAYLPNDMQVSLLKGKLPGRTANSITDSKTLLRELEEIRVQGYATAFEELEEGLNALSAPIFDHRGQVIASVSVSGPAYRLTPERIEQIAPDVIKTALEISKKQGYSNSA